MLVKFRAGDRAAFLTVYDLFADKIRLVSQRFFSMAFDQEEAVQEIWLMVHRQCAQFDSQKGDLGGWLWAVATNRCKELWRSRSRRPDQSHAVEVSDEQPGLLPEGEPPEASVKNKRVEEAMNLFCSQLSEKEAQVFRLSCLGERSHDDVAALTGLSPRQCKYLRMKLLQQAAEAPGLQRVLQELTFP